MSKATKNRARGVYLVPLPTLDVNATNVRKSKTGLDDLLRERDIDAFTALPRIPWDHPQFKHWDTDDADGLPDELLNAADIDAWLDPAKKPPPITWAVDGLIALNETTAVGGGAGAGKTTFVLNLMMGVALGECVLNFKIEQPRRVQYAMLERHENGFWRRVRKAVMCLFPKLKPEQRQTLRENFLRSALAGKPVRLVEHRQNQWAVHKANVDALIERMKEQRIEVLVFDTLSRLHGGNSNDDSLATSLTTAFERITQTTGAAVIILTHTGKKPQEGMYGGARGSSAWVDNTSNMIGLRLLDEDERSKVKVISDVKEAQDDTLIVEMNHLRMSETTTHPTQHFAIKHGGDMDGWMWSVGVKYVASDAASIADDVRRWFVQDLKECPFTMTGFIKACKAGTFGGHIGRPTAETTFKKLLQEGHIQKAEQERKGKPLYTAAFDGTGGTEKRPNAKKSRKNGQR